MSCWTLAVYCWPVVSHALTDLYTSRRLHVCGYVCDSLEEGTGRGVGLEVEEREVRMLWRSRQRGAWSSWLLQGFFDHVVCSMDLMQALWVTARV